MYLHGDNDGLFNSFSRYAEIINRVLGKDINEYIPVVESIEDAAEEGIPYDKVMNQKQNLIKHILVPLIKPLIVASRMDISLEESQEELSKHEWRIMEGWLWQLLVWVSCGFIVVYTW